VQLSPEGKKKVFSRKEGDDSSQPAQPSPALTSFHISREEKFCPLAKRRTNKLLVCAKIFEEQKIVHLRNNFFCFNFFTISTLFVRME
jgi:hypothetical protein